MLPSARVNPSNVGKTKINHPSGNGLYNLFMVIWGIVYYDVLPTFMLVIAQLG